MEKKIIEETIGNYNKLIELAKAKIEVIKKIDNQFNTARGIISITIEQGFVFVECDDSCRGCYDTLSFSFPIHYLTTNDEELKNIIQTEKDNRIAKEELAKEQKQIKDKAEKERQEFLQYQRLKEKFDSTPPAPGKN